MAGNVFEWTWDILGNYEQTAQTDPRGPSSGSGRVFRGGSWKYDGGAGCRVASRFDSYYRAYRINYLGFRSVLPPGQP